MFAARDSRPSGPWLPPEKSERGLLTGVRVVDLSRVLAGPFTAMHLADLGADVIKVEIPGRGDESRHVGPPFASDGTAAYYLSANRNKRSMTVDITSEEGTEIVLRLAETADVLIDNMLPGKLESYGLGRGAFEAVNPQIVTVTISGFGSGNAYTGRPGFDFLAQAMGGMMAVTGHEQTGPTRVGVPINDLVAALYAVQAITAALVQRSWCDRGHHIEVSLLDTQIALLANRAYGWLVAEFDPPLAGNQTPSVAPYGTFMTKDKPIAIAVAMDAQFRSLVRAIELSELEQDSRFTTNTERVRHRDQLTALLEGRLQQNTRDHWLERLDVAMVPAAPVNSVNEALTDPVVADRQVSELDGSPYVRSPIWVDDGPLEIRSNPPKLGAHTHAILSGLGYSSADVEDFASRSIT